MGKEDRRRPRGERIGQSVEARIGDLTVVAASNSELCQNGLGLSQIKIIFRIGDKTIDNAKEDGLISAIRRRGQSETYGVSDVVTLLFLNSSNNLRPQIRKKVPRIASDAYREYQRKKEEEVRVRQLK